ncbi:UDP-N-acetylmuramate--L-alanine ligase [Nakamurella antarctica]|uniref:UDP-N-acetylmuramate--L-alanine ligase n=2 Tax=Nakamurella antarctica TaxID=1902245 RepID=A0A3G8ZRL3_9ACTN|nr:UDP-N-acetylmuramate--L-alanine ligase [Nakamurella antarctica]
MSAIARILIDRGFVVSGSDAKGSHVLTGLTARGVKTAIGQRAENLDLLTGGPTAVVISTAINPSNPELAAARERGIPIVRRASALAALMDGYRRVCVAGTHGKTSTTSMLTVALQHAGVDPSFAIGGELNESGTGAHSGSGDIFIAEADESDGSFLAYSPHGAIITNLEPDHLDHHGSAEAYTAVFDQFAQRIAPGGFLIACVDDPGVAALVGRLGVGSPRVIGYGRSATADVLLRDSEQFGHGSRMTIETQGRSHTLTLDVPGEHMALNAVAAFAAGLALGIDAEPLIDGLARYTGVRRRFEFKGRAAGVVVYDDYAHHPTEVSAQIAAARTIVGQGRLVVIFQPHLYSRTQTFAVAFGRALAGADLVIQMDVYGAREEPQVGVSGQLIVDAIPAGTAIVVYEPSMAATATTAAALLVPGDVVITMGAGDVTMIGPELLELLTAGEESR